MLPIGDERLHGWVINGILARLDGIETRLNFYNEDMVSSEATRNNRCFAVNQALGSIDANVGWLVDRLAEQQKEIAALKLRIVDLENERATQERVNQVLTKYIKNFGRSLTKLIRTFFRLNNDIEADHLDLTTLEIWRNFSHFTFFSPDTN